jgi:group II intron reverse transcriptase/maturase
MPLTNFTCTDLPALYYFPEHLAPACFLLSGAENNMSHPATKLSEIGIEEVVSEQNLYCAWEAVARKNGGPGLDRISVEDCARRVQTELVGIRSDVLSGTYKPGPLMSCPTTKPQGGIRELTIVRVRDRILSRAIAQTLTQHYDADLAPQSYAYRHGKGALKAVAAVQQACRQASHVLRADIKDFFDTIEHDALRAVLKDRDVAAPVENLIMDLICAARFDGVSCQHPLAGVPQGSPLSPVLSNLYLDAFDQVLALDYPRFLRYADDLVVFCESADEASAAMRRLGDLLNQIGLTLSTDKTRVYSVDTGFLFLGFVFNRHGHAASREARDRLRQKLDEGPCVDENSQDYQKRREAIVRGWNQYFHHDDPPGALAPAHPGPGHEDSEVMDEPIPCLDEETDVPDQPEEREEDIVSLRRALAADEMDAESAAYREKLGRLAGHYERAGLKGAAAACRKEAGLPETRTEKSEAAAAPVSHSTHGVECWRSLFGYGEGNVAVAYCDRLGRLGYRPAYAKLTAKLLQEHWQGRRSLAVPVYGPHDHVRFAVIDIDITRKTLDLLNRQERETLRGELLKDAVALLQRAKHAGVDGVIEASGYKGYHVWFFSHQPLEAKLLKQFLEELTRISGPPPAGSHRELFPASASRPPEGLQTRIKMPLGMHWTTRERSHWITPAGEVWKDAGPDMIHESIFNTARTFREAIHRWTRYTSAPAPSQETPAETATAPSRKLRRATRTVNSASAVETVRSGCPVLAALFRKAELDRFLTHGERMVARGILQPLGQEGVEAVHDLMRQCDNYDRKVTESFLQRQSAKPMACTTIREVLGDFCEQAGCACRFKTRKGDYAHPLRHLNQRERTTTAKTTASPTPPQRLPDAPPSDDLMELLKAYHETRNRLKDLCEQIEQVHQNHPHCSLGRLIRHDHDPDLPGWSLQL